MSISCPANTTVMILAAGQGKRMRPLTDNTPKPLLMVAGRSLIGHHLIALKKQLYKNIVINVDYLGSQIIQKLGDGKQYGLNIKYSDESSCSALETAGGIANALHLIESEYFIVVNADIWTNYCFTNLNTPFESHETLAKLILVKNPEHNPEGDFSIDENGKIESRLKTGKIKKTRYTFSGIGIYKKALFLSITPHKLSLAKHLSNHIDKKHIEADIFNGIWSDIGTPERLDQLNHDLLSQQTL